MGNGFGENVRWLRKRAGMSQQSLANLIWVNHHHPTRSYVSRLEHGTLDPRLSTIRSLARVFKMRPWQLVADLSDNAEFWRGYLALSPTQKREVQHNIKWMLRK